MKKVYEKGGVIHSVLVETNRGLLLKPIHQIATTEEFAPKEPEVPKAKEKQHAQEYAPDHQG